MDVVDSRSWRLYWYWTKLFTYRQFLTHHYSFLLIFFLGVVFGGFISDRVVKKTGPHGRIWVLALSQIISSPFAAGVLFLDPPYCYFSLLPNYIIGFSSINKIYKTLQVN